MSQLIFDFKFITAFFAMQFIGCFGCLAVVLTGWLSPIVHRHSTWYSLLISWTLSSVYYSLLLLTGQYGVVDPPFALCLIQSSLIYAAPILVAGTVGASTINVWLETRSFLTRAAGEKIRPSIIVSLLVVPYALHILISLEVLITGIRDPDTVRLASSGTYCGISNGIPGKISSAVVIFLLLVTVIVQGLIVTRLYRHWHTFPKLRINIFNLISTLGRVMALSFLCIMAMCFGFLWFVDLDLTRFKVINILLSTLPIAAALLFGTQQDILRAWRLMKDRRPVPVEKVSDEDLKSSV